MTNGFARPYRCANMKKHKEIPKNNDTKKLIVFFAVLIAVAAGGMFLFLRNLGDEGSAGNLPSVGADGYQEVRMIVNGAQYEPSTLTVKAGQKVRWIVDGTNAQGCAQSMYSPQLGINTMLKRGDNVFEFTPSEAGTIKFSCSMGMSRGQFQVV